MAMSVRYVHCASHVSQKSHLKYSTKPCQKLSAEKLHTHTQTYTHTRIKTLNGIQVIVETTILPYFWRTRNLNDAAQKQFANK